MGLKKGEDDESTRVVEYVGRNFYGALKVTREGTGFAEEMRLTHGVILHGMQLTDPSRRNMHTTYYGRFSGVGIALAEFPRQQNQRVGLVGLGAGTLTSYGKPGDYYRIYEINPDVPNVARRYFTYLNDCLAEHEIILGDARVSMERERDEKDFQRFDVLALDAFSSDAIPVHLLTREAFQLYFLHLAPDGVLAVHISNRHLDLEPVVFSLAREMDARAATISNGANGQQGVYASTWVLVTRNDDFLGKKAVQRDVSETPVDLEGFRPWTDDYSNLLQVLKK